MRCRRPNATSRRRNRGLGQPGAAPPNAKIVHQLPHDDRQHPWHRPGIRRSGAMGELLVERGDGSPPRPGHRPVVPPPGRPGLHRGVQLRPVPEVQEVLHLPLAPLEHHLQHPARLRGVARRDRGNARPGPRTGWCRPCRSWMTGTTGASRSRTPRSWTIHRRRSSGSTGSATGRSRGERARLGAFMARVRWMRPVQSGTCAGHGCMDGRTSHPCGGPGARARSHTRTGGCDWWCRRWPGCAPARRDRG